MLLRSSPTITVLILTLFLITVGPVWAGLPDQSDQAMATDLQTDLTSLPLEALMQLEVVTAGRQAQPLSEVAAAIFVITQEDIRRSGATTIPEALRLAPGVQVARLDANKWAISARGFNSRFATKLLVLVDGRTVYTPLFSGVFWDAQDTVIEDIDRIEVIRGPGGTLWGANAVNGVINIITKKARDTQGGLAVAGGGTEERGFGSLRYGGTLGQAVHYRVYGKYFNRDRGFHPDGAHDDWRMGRGGFRADWDGNNRDVLTLSGEYYGGEAGERVTLPTLTTPFTRRLDQDISLSGGHLLTRWTRRLDRQGELALQLYYDRTKQTPQRGGYTQQTYDLDVQHRQSLPRQTLLVGAGYRLSTDDIPEGHNSRFSPQGRALRLLSGFLQDDIALIERRLTLTIGTKVLHNNLTGVEVQPSGRLRWTPAAGRTFWTAVSRAVRTPSRADHDAVTNLVGTAGGFVELRGDRAVRSETVLAYELGTRLQATDRLFLDLAAFYNRYSGLIVAESRTAPHLTNTNAAKAETAGVEVAADWQAHSSWRLRLAYTYLHMQLYPNRLPGNTDADSAEDESPSHQVSFRSLLNVSKTVELDAWVRAVDRLSALNVGGYVTLDLRLGWQPIKGLDLSLVGQNLLDPHRPEFTPSFVTSQPTEAPRGFYGKLTWRF